MGRQQRGIKQRLALFILGILLLSMPSVVLAASPQNPQSNSLGFEGTVAGAPPTTGATITTPTNGQTFTTGPVTVAGLCPSGLLVKIFSNNVFMGSVPCTNGSFSIKVDLFNGRNDIVARVYDALDQAGPDSNTITVQFSSAQFAQFGTQLTITSNYAKRGVSPGQQLTWPIVINGGTATYALSVDWGDASDPTLLSEPTAGSVTLDHTYKAAGTYAVIIKGADKNGETAFLQVVAVANGAITASSSNGSSTTGKATGVIWWPAAILLPLLFVTFWLGDRYELFTLRKQLEHTDDQFD